MGPWLYATNDVSCPGTQHKNSQSSRADSSIRGLTQRGVGDFLVSRVCLVAVLSVPESTFWAGTTKELPICTVFIGEWLTKSHFPIPPPKISQSPNVDFISLVRPQKGTIKIPGSDKKSQPTYFLYDRKYRDDGDGKYSLSLYLLGLCPWWRIENGFITKHTSRKHWRF